MSSHVLYVLEWLLSTDRTAKSHSSLSILNEDWASSFVTDPVAKLVWSDFSHHMSITYAVIFCHYQGMTVFLRKVCVFVQSGFCNSYSHMYVYMCWVKASTDTFRQQSLWKYFGKELAVEKHVLMCAADIQVCSLQVTFNPWRLPLRVRKVYTLHCLKVRCGELPKVTHNG